MRIKKPRPPRMKESVLQTICMKWIGMQYPHVIAYHVPNGGKRNFLEAVQFKRMGVLAGVPDVIIDEPCGGYHGARIELKIFPNKVTDEQKAILERYKHKGYFVDVCFNFESFQETVKHYLNLNES